MPSGLWTGGTVKTGRDLKILLVEDAPTDAELIVDCLAAGGLDFTWMRVYTQSALALAVSAFKPDIMLCDKNLPDFDGRSAVQFVRRRNPLLPIVIVTDTLDDESAVALVKAGANDYVRKDRLAHLPIVVEQALEGARQHRKQEEHDAALLASELRHRRRFETATDGILVANADTLIIYEVNESLLNLLGWPRDDCLGKTLADLGLLRTETGDELPIKTMLQTGDSYTCNLPMYTKDGRNIDVEFVAVVYPVGNDFAVQCNLRDITIRRYLEEQLKSKNRDLEASNLAKDNFFASMSHEIRTPLNGIIGFTGTLLMKLPGDLTHEQEKQLKVVRDSANHLLNLINDLLHLAKIGSGALDLGAESVDCRKMLDDVANSLSQRAAAKSLNLEILAPPSDVVVTTSNRALWQIVTNLTANAIKFTSAGSVSLGLKESIIDGHKRIDIAVNDTGVGIKKEDLAKLFLPFSRVGDTTDQQQEGAGLGLHICEKLASLIGAKISVVSEYHKGSTFTISLTDGYLS